MGYHSDRAEHLSVLNELFELKNKRIKVTVTLKQRKSGMLQKQALKIALIINYLNGIWNMEFLMFGAFFLGVRKKDSRLDIEESPL